jgi:hypothetical protein
MNFDTFKKAMPIGFAATVVMTVYLYVAGTLNLPRTDFHEMITSHLHTTEMGTWLVYFLFGGFFANVYRTFFHEKLPDHSWKRGLYYGVFLWLFTGLVLMPFMGMTMFAGSVMTAVGLFLAVAMYGATVGYLYE